MAHVIIQNEGGNIISHQNLINNSCDEDDDDFLKNASKGRRVTDLPFLIFHAVCVGFLGVLIIYCIATGDIDRILKGYDKCGNVCGKKNDFTIQRFGSGSCTSMNMIDKPYLVVNSGDNNYNECAEKCTNGVLILNRCIKNGLSLHNTQQVFLNYISSDLNICASEITVVSFLTIALALTMLLILRYFTAVFVWCSIVGTVLLLVAATAYCWYMVSLSDAFIAAGGFLTFVTLIIIILVICMRNRIQLVIQLFKESAKSLTSMPLLLIEPVLTIIVLAIVLAVWIYFTLLIESAATPVDINGHVIFISNGFIKFVRFYNLFIMLWMIFFVYGCQNMLIAGAVARWYFIRDKKMLVNPILNSGIIMIKYHLGTISIGSLIIALMYIIRMLWAELRKRIRAISYLLCLCLCFETLDLFLNNIGSVLNYFTLNIYVVSAIHGSTFLRSGRKAFKLLVNNVQNVIAINSIGDFVLFLTKILIIVIPIAIGYAMLMNKNHINIVIPLTFIAFIAILVAQCFIMVFEMAITTTFICFCQDCEINDGFSRPYYMSQNLMDFVEKSKAVLKVKDTT